MKLSPPVSLIILALSTAWLFPGCDKKEPAGQSADAARKVLKVRGIVRGINQEEQTLIVEHEDIPGFMPSMTMPFYYKDAKDVSGLENGQAVRFDFVVTETDSWLTAVEKIDPASVNLPAAEPAKPETAPPPRLKEADAMPDFQLIDQEQRALTPGSFKGKALLFTFIFTRCPVPNFCPLMSQRFSELEKQIAADPALADRMRLLSITIDPEFDTPEVLAKYATGFGGKPDLWRFATGSRVEIEKLTGAFAVYVKPEAGTISHGLATVLVDDTGRIRKIWRGNAWTVDEVLKEMREL